MLHKVKLSIILLLTSITMFTYAVPTRAQEVTTPDKDTIERVLDMVEVSAAQVAEAVKNVAPEVWRIYVRQAQITGWTIVGSAAFFGLLTLACFGGAGVGYRRDVLIHRAQDSRFSPDWDDSALRIVLTVIGAIAGTFFAILAICVIVEGLAEILNPEYYAISKLIEGLVP